MIPYGRQDINQADIDAVLSVLHSDYLTQGPIVPNFEEEVARYVGSRHGIAVNSATSALHIACLALNLGSEDWLWTSPITFAASSNCALYCGAKVDFVDIDPQTYNICPKKLEAKLEQAKKIGKLPKIVVPVHLAGQPCEMEAIYKLSKKYGFKIIEDASHAIGGSYKGKLIGDCLYSDITIFSFHPVKIITTGEGGMALTNDNKLASHMRLLRSHGITRDPDQLIRGANEPWYYEQIALGYNYRMTEIQAALGLSQLSRLSHYVERRREIATRYDRLLAKSNVKLPWQHPDGYSAFHLYIIRLNLSKNQNSRLRVFEILREKNIMVNLHYIPIYKHPYYQKIGFNDSEFPEAERYYREAISIPLFPALTEVEQDHVCKSINEACYA